MAEVSKQPELVPGQPSVERPADSPNAEPHPVEDLREVPRPTVEELLAKNLPVMSSGPMSPGAGSLTSEVKSPQTSEVSPPADGPVEELLKIDETKTFGFTDAAQLAQKLQQLRQQGGGGS